MPKEMILYKNNKVFFHGRNSMYRLKDAKICPLCLKKICKGDSIYLIMNNYILFPNLFVHKACVSSKEECIKQLVSSYEEAKKAFKKHEFWKE